MDRRSNSFVWKSDLPAAARGSTYSGLMHVTDMWPTLLGIASGGTWAPAPGQVLDGYDQWPAILSGGSIPSPRDSAVLVYYTVEGDNALGSALRWDSPTGERYKLILDLGLGRADWFPVPTVCRGWRPVDPKCKHPTASLGVLIGSCKPMCSLGRI